MLQSQRVWITSSCVTARGLVEAEGQQLMERIAELVERKAEAESLG
jgi:hypothetical protein